MPNRSQFKTNEEYNACMLEYRNKNREKIRAYNRVYNKNWRDKYGYASENRYRLLNPDKCKARQLLNYAIKIGMIERLPCEVCGGVKSQGHHDDYTKPLEVKWLCPVCHTTLHRDRG